jgi:hypothetical protein
MNYRILSKTHSSYKVETLDDFEIVLRSNFIRQLLNTNRRKTFLRTKLGILVTKTFDR